MKEGVCYSFSKTVIYSHLVYPIDSSTTDAVCRKKNPHVVKRRGWSWLIRNLKKVTVKRNGPFFDRAVTGKDWMKGKKATFTPNSPSFDLAVVSRD